MKTYLDLIKDKTEKKLINLELSIDMGPESIDNVITLATFDESAAEDINKLLKKERRYNKKNRYKLAIYDMYSNITEIKYLEKWYPMYKTIYSEKYIDTYSKVVSKVDADILFLSDSYKNKEKLKPSIFKNVLIAQMHETIYSMMYDYISEYDTDLPEISDNVFNACIELIDKLKSHKIEFNKLDKNDILNKFKACLIEETNSILEIRPNEVYENLFNKFVKKYTNLENAIDQVILKDLGDDIYNIISLQINNFLDYFIKCPIPELYFYLDHCNLADINNFIFYKSEITYYR